MFPAKKLLPNISEKNYMYKQKFILGVAIVATFVCGTFGSVFAIDHKVKKQATFKVRVENISDKDGIAAQDGSKYPFALSPGFYTLSNDKMDLFKVGKKASPALEALAEDGNPELFAKKLLTVLGSINIGVFAKPVGADKASPIFPNGAFEFEFSATEGTKLDLTTMYGQSNDLFYGPDHAINLFDADGKPLNGDITDKFLLWDAGTEVNQAPGLGADQGPRQKGPNTGVAENGVVRLVKDGFSYPNTKAVLRITITAQ
jgi:hypothetical protein